MTKANFKNSIVLMILITSVSAFAQKPFRVRIEGPRRYIDVYKKRAELKMARSTDFCRGFNMPKINSSWSCRPSDGKNHSCTASYRCALIRKNFSRVSETKRIRKELGGLPRVRNSFAMVVGKKPLRNPDKYRYVKEIERRRKAARVVEKNQIRRKVKERTNKLKKQLTEFDEFAQLEKELSIDNTPMTAGQRKANVDNLSSSSLEEDKKQLGGQTAEVAPFRLERMKSNRGNEEIIRIKRAEDAPVEEERKFQLFSFSGAITRVTDSNASSVATADVAWTPSYRFSDKWGFRGRVGGKFISSEIVVGEDPETFLVYDLAGDFEYYPFLGRGFYLSGGAGIQSWSSSTGGSFSTISMGAGWLFDFNKAKIVDRLFVTYTSVGNEAANKEMKFGIGVSF